MPIASGFSGNSSFGRRPARRRGTDLPRRYGKNTPDRVWARNGERLLQGGPRDEQMRKLVRQLLDLRSDRRLCPGCRVVQPQPIVAVQN